MSKPKVGGSSAVRYAAKNGYLEIVKLLLPVSDPKAYDSLALQRAAEDGPLETVRLLLPVSDSKAGNSLALRCAAQNGHLEIVKLLLKGSDPKAYGSLALRAAAKQGHLEIVDLLLPHSDCSNLFKLKWFTDSSACDILLSRLPASFVLEFMVTNPTLGLPRTSAMLASDSLQQRPTTSRKVATQRQRT